MDLEGATDDALNATVRAMTRAVQHRGPDGNGVWCDPMAGVALGHQRLAVIDLTEHGHQPMVSADGRYVLVFNGEIYNHREMAGRLSSAGVALRGHSDTEVLLETIARGSLVEALEAANGMFALALWDRRDRRMTLARDRIGEKPLYYAYQRRRLTFASELTALRCDAELAPSLDHGALAQFVRHSYVPGPHTIYSGVRKLAPGHTVTFEPGHLDEPEQRPFWSLRDAVARGLADPLTVADDALVSQAEDLLRDSVRMRMIADVPLGAFLSGGIDSSLVVALMQTVSDRPVRSFTVSVGGQFDESSHAAAIARHLGTDHTELRLTEADALTLAPDIPSMYDEPFADPSAVPTALVSAAARRHVTACLTGDGGDEVLAGYNRYLAADRLLSQVLRVPAGLRSPAGRAILRVPPHRWDQWGGALPNGRRLPDLGTKMHKLARVLSTADPHGAYRALTSHLEPSSVLRTASERVSAMTSQDSWLGRLDPLSQMLYLDGVMTLPDNMLVKVDRASMAVALECRVPLLDHRFVEFAWRLPHTAKIRNRQGKWLLRQILRRHVPDQLFERPKQGFDPPVADWLRGSLREWAGDLLSPNRLRSQGIFDPAGVSTLVAEHMSGRRNHDYAVWTLVVFQAWWEGQQVSVMA